MRIIQNLNLVLKAMTAFYERQTATPALRLLDDCLNIMHISAGGDDSASLQRCAQKLGEAFNKGMQDATSVFSKTADPFVAARYNHANAREGGAAGPSPPPPPKPKLRYFGDGSDEPEGVIQSEFVDEVEKLLMSARRRHSNLQDEARRLQVLSSSQLPKNI